MKTSISNIAWDAAYDEEMYDFLKKNHVDGLEIAPTRIFPECPYEKIKEASVYKTYLKETWGLEISSMQSIWYGKREVLFGDQKQREVLLEYTKKAMEFAHALECKNLVFGCPKNRNLRSAEDLPVAIDFFHELGTIAEKEDTVLALEANPAIYNTNFMNTTQEAYDFVKEVSSSGIKINVDLGTIKENKEDFRFIEKILPEVNHVHMSEPFLAEIKFEKVNEEMIDLLNRCHYDKYLSIEMKNLNDISKVQNIIKHLLKLVRSQI